MMEASNIIYGSSLSGKAVEKMYAIEPPLISASAETSSLL